MKGDKIGEACGGCGREREFRQDFNEESCKKNFTCKTCALISLVYITEVARKEMWSEDADSMRLAYDVDRRQHFFQNCSRITGFLKCVEVLTR